MERLSDEKKKPYIAKLEADFKKYEAERKAYEKKKNAWAIKKLIINKRWWLLINDEFIYLNIRYWSYKFQF